MGISNSDSLFSIYENKPEDSVTKKHQTFAKLQFSNVIIENVFSTSTLKKQIEHFKNVYLDNSKYTFLLDCVKR